MKTVAVMHLQFKAVILKCFAADAVWTKIYAIKMCFRELEAIIPDFRGSLH